MTEPFVLAQISDLHVGSKVAPNGRTGAESLRFTLAALAARKPDAILATGDLVNDARPEEYAELAAILADAPAPLYLMAGNHDDADLMRAAFPGHAYLPPRGPLSYVIERHPLRLVMLDATIPGQVPGAFTPDHAAWLDAALAAAPTTPTIVALHHPPFTLYDRLFDTIDLENRDLFTDVIARHAQVQRIVCGHHHRLATGKAAHAPVVIAPSTAWTYGLALRPEDPIAPKTSEPCGFLLHVWRAETGLASHFIAM